MLIEIESFRKTFRNYTDYYAIIGEAACDILLMEAYQRFRPTKDINMILIMEDNFPKFAAVFRKYIKEGSHRCDWNNSDDMHF